MKQWIKKLLPLAVAGALVLPALAADEQVEQNIAPLPGCYEIAVDGGDTGIDACIMVPLRTMAESMGFTVTWADGAALVDNGVMHTSVIPGVDRYLVATSVDGMLGTSAPFSLGIPPYAVDGVIYVPLGLFDALLGRQEGAFQVEGNTVEIHTQETQIPNPFVTCQTLEQAEALAGFSAPLPQMWGGWELTGLRAVEGAMLEMDYQLGDAVIHVRKAPGSGDISGDYTSYPDAAVQEVAGHQMTVRGEGETIYVVLWTEGEYTYAVTSSQGVKGDTLKLLAESLV